MSDYPFEAEVVDFGTTSFVRLTPGDWMMHSTFMEAKEKIYNIDVKPDDVWLLSHPKTGTTWACELVWTVYNQGDVETANTTPQFNRWLFPEFDFFTKPFYNTVLKDQEVDEDVRKEFTKSRLDETINAPSPRLIKTHLPLSVLPDKLVDKCKVIYVCRNPLDTCVSYYHFGNSMATTKLHTDLPLFTDLFVAEVLPFGPYWKHVKVSWDLRDHPNMLFLTYEEMKQDIRSVMKKVSDFLGKPLTQEQMDKIADYVSLEKMKDNRMVNMDIYKDYGLYKKESKFMRKGAVGDFQNNLTPDQSQKIKEWWNTNMGDSGLAFPGVDLSC